MPHRTREIELVVHIPTDQVSPRPPDEADPVFEALDRAESAYRVARTTWAQDALDAEQAREQIAAARSAEQSAREQLRQLRGQYDAEREKTQRLRERSSQLLAALKDVHKTLFSGNVYEAILRACLTLTGATRGLYLISDAGELRVRAAVGVGGYPDRAPSEFLRALCEHALRDGKSSHFNGPRDFVEFPPPENDSEAFDNSLVVQAVLLESINGVVVLCDKPDGFDDDDVESVMSIGDGAGVALRNQHLQNEVTQAYFSVVAVLADAMEVKDPYTKGHCQMVSRYARLTAARLASADAKLRSLCSYGGLLHDVGKIGISDGVLNKPGTLTPEEWAMMQSHVRIGRDLLARVPALDGVTDVVLHHHERWDGGGYPDGLRAEQISLASRIVCVVDAYSAMISKRSYKDSLSVEKARAELLRCRGTHFDPAVVDAFVVVLDDPRSAEDAPMPDGSAIPPGLTDAADFHYVLNDGKA